ncbi:hypothetical protein ACPPVU_04670 [Mucilaginibacter sp. McL0603]|uniref:hypothetical protein n=1 Tax=Mucilaginibacter sp. McL0603 TaxID=3415670 RepID=UPI003CEA3196
MENHFWIALLDKLCIPIIIAALSYFLAKRQLLSGNMLQFRQRWIDDLRNAISLFIAKAEMISIIDLDDDDSYFSHSMELSQMQNKVELMLNPNVDTQQIIINRMSDIKKIIHEEEVNEDKLKALINDLLEMSRGVLSKEMESCYK